MLFIKFYPINGTPCELVRAQKSNKISLNELYSCGPWVILAERLSLRDVVYNGCWYMGLLNDLKSILLTEKRNAGDSYVKFSLF